MKRICMIVHAIYPIGEPRVHRYASALLGRGDQVDVICLRNPGEARVENADGATVYRMPVRRHKGQGVVIQFLEYLAFFVLASFQVAMLHLRHRYHIIHVHNPPDFLVFAALIPKLMGAKVILDLHDLMPEFYRARFGNQGDNLALRVLCLQERLSCRFADQVLTVTELWRATLAERIGDENRTAVVMNVADTQIFRQLSHERPTTANGSCHLIYHGQLTKRYGIDLAIWAVNLVRHQVPHIRLTIHGHGEFLGELRSLTDELGLQDHIVFSTKLVPMADMPVLIASADIGIVPYRRDIFTDGILPTKLMEYAALGMPAIAARTPTIEAYFDETMVEFFRPGDVDDLANHILALHRNRLRLTQLRQGIRAFNQRYNWSLVSAEYLHLIDQLTRQ